MKYNLEFLVLIASIVLATATASRASAGTVYVDQSSPNPTPPYSTPTTAAHDIQDAVDVTTNGDIVLVEPGHYDLTHQITITNGILLQSADGAGRTIINAQTNISGPTNAWCLWISNSAAVVDGFTIQCPSGADLAGATFLDGGTVQNCDFTNYTIYAPGSEITMTGGILSNSLVDYLGGPGGDGSAIYCTNGGLVTDCQIRASGNLPETTGIYLANSTVANSSIFGSHGAAPGGGGPALDAVSSSVIHCTITHNWSQGFGPGGGALLDSSFMDRCTVIGNTLYGAGLGTNQRGGVGGGGIFESNSIIRDSLIVSNAVSNLPSTGIGAGGGVFMQGGELVNCTVSGNCAASGTNAPPEGPGVYVDSGSVTNSIIFLNVTHGTAGDSFNAGSGVFDHCCTTPNPGGIGNITQDPQFVDPANGDFHPKSTSPCMDAGVVQPWMAGAQDLDGNPRTVHGTVDMGAYEHPAVSPQPVEILNPQWLNGSFSCSFPTQTNNAYYVQYTPSLAPASWKTLISFVGNGTTTDVTNQNADVPAGYYRVVAQ